MPASIWTPGGEHQVAPSAQPPKQDVRVQASSPIEALRQITAQVAKAGDPNAMISMPAGFLVALLAQWNAMEQELKDLGPAKGAAQPKGPIAQKQQFGRRGKRRTR